MTNQEHTQNEASLNPFAQTALSEEGRHPTINFFDETLTLALQENISHEDIKQIRELTRALHSSGREFQVVGELGSGRSFQRRTNKHQIDPARLKHTLTNPETVSTPTPKDIRIGNYLQELTNQHATTTAREQ